MADWKLVPKWRCWCPLPQEANGRSYISDRDSEAECFDSMMQHLRSKREHFLHRTEAQLRGIVEDYGGSGFEWATTPEDRTRLWRARHDAFWAVKAQWPGTDLLATDVCVPDLEKHGK